MGFFSELFTEPDIVQVNTTVSRVVEDNLVPNSIRSGMLRSMFENEDLADSVVEDMITGMGVRSERMYEYANQHYTYGMPASKYFSDNQSTDEISSVLTTLEGTTVSINYAHISPPNVHHIGWMQLIEDYGYDPLTNELTVISAIKGYPVYLVDMVVNVPENLKNTVDSAVTRRWGTSSAGGYSPHNLVHSPLLSGMVPHSPIHIGPVEGPGMGVSLRVYYAWDIPSFNPFSDITSHDIHDENMVMEVLGYNPLADYYHVKYTKLGVATPIYWLYPLGNGTYPTLDTLFEIPPEELGTYFPFMYFRFDDAAVPISPGNPAYDTSKKLLKYIGVDYPKLITSINSNPDIGDVQQAMMMMAVPANSSNEIEQRYLYDYFLAMHGGTFSAASSPVMRQSYTALPTSTLPTIANIAIQDSRFKMTLSHSGIYKRRKAGVLGKVGTHTVTTTTEIVSQDYTVEVEGTTITMPQTTPVTTHYYRRQISDVLYDEVSVVNLQMTYHIWNGYVVTGDDVDKILLIPLDHSITKDYSIPDRELLYARSLHFVFNSLVITSIKWYQTEIFRAIIIIIAVIIMAYSAGQAWKEAMMLLVFTTTTLTYILLSYLIKYIVFTILFKLFVKAVGVKVAFIVAILAAVMGISAGFDGSAVASAPWASSLLTVSNGLIQAGLDEVKNDMEDLLNEQKAYQNEMESKNELLDDAAKLLERTDVLSPFIILGESPDDFFQRTVHSGNIGVMGIDAISNYVAVSLALPKYKDTIRENYIDHDTSSV